jgi:hypothetical protein
MVLLELDDPDRETLVLGDDDVERPVSGTLLDGVAEVDCRAKIGFVQRVSRLLVDQER